jgi:hypothetical protein
MPTRKTLKRLPMSMVKVVKAPPGSVPVLPTVPPQVDRARAEANAARVAAAGGRQNLYVAAKDQDVWERAEKLAAPESLSSLVTRLLRRHVNQLQVAKDRVVVDIEEYNDYTVRKAFVGRHLVSAFQSDQGTHSWYAAQGAKGGLAVWLETTEGDPAKLFRTYRDFDAFAADRSMPRDLVSAVSAAMGEQYAEEIDL